MKPGDLVEIGGKTRGRMPPTAARAGHVPPRARAGHRATGELLTEGTAVALHVAVAVAVHVDDHDHERRHAPATREPATGSTCRLIA